MKNILGVARAIIGSKVSIVFLPLPFPLVSLLFNSSLKGRDMFLAFATSRGPEVEKKNFRVSEMSSFAAAVSAKNSGIVVETCEGCEALCESPRAIKRALKRKIVYR